MSFIGWLKNKLGGVPVPLSGFDFCEIDEICADICFREMAFWSAVNLTSNSISKCEFKTFVSGAETKEKEYYLWNVEPNKNQNSSAFIRKIISQLFRNNECLVIENVGQLVIADSFDRTPYALYEDVFKNVTVGDFTFNKSFVGSEVMYFTLSEMNMRKVSNALYSSYSKLIAYTMKAYQKSRGTKGIFKYETLPVTGTAERAVFDSLVNEKIGKWLHGDNAALPMGKGQEWKELDKKTYSSESTRDIKAMIDDISDFTAKSFGIPPALLRGDIQGTSDALDQFLTFCIDPIADMMSEEINRKRSGYAGFSSGTYLQIDTKTIKHIDLLSVATSIDKLISSGAFTINDIRKAVNESEIKEGWANEHFMTKNYATVSELLEAMKGGENV